MSRPQTHEQILLNKAAKILSDYSSSYDCQLRLLEVCASICGGFDIEEYWTVFQIMADSSSDYLEVARTLVAEIQKTGVPIALAISALSREPIPLTEQKKHGAFYTDFRLAQFVAENCVPYLNTNSKVADLAAGSGILLAAVAEEYYRLHPATYDNWLSHCVFAFDLSENALRGARAALSVHAKTVGLIKQMCSNWFVGDSLDSTIIDKNSFDIVVGNPPWGKVKLSLHEFVTRTGLSHLYGASYSDYDKEQFLAERHSSHEYSKFLKTKYTLLGNAEPDLYMAFLQKALTVLKKNGHLAYLVPAGLIRSKGTEALRRYLLKNCHAISFTLLDNKPNFFTIDTRFKFVLVSCDHLDECKKPAQAFTLYCCKNAGSCICNGSGVTFPVEELETIRPDLTIPECRNNEEKNLFLKICSRGQAWDRLIQVDISREIDMTNDKPKFQKENIKGSIPVIEGRMVQAHRFGAKTYISGDGRSAKWLPCNGKGDSQYYIKEELLSDALRERVRKERAGYCDIAGQTNERAMMSAVIPANVVCGNKVPTIRFLGNNCEQQLFFWIGVTNSFVFDWLIRRVISTTINYFLLFSIPMPNISLDHPLAQTIISATKALSKMNGEYYTSLEMQQLRAEIDVAVAKAYDVSFSELELILEDFPLLDRAQPPLKSERQSTITRDLLLSTAEKSYDTGTNHYLERTQAAQILKAKAYIPSEMTCLCKRRRKNESYK